MKRATMTISVVQAVATIRSWIAKTLRLLDQGARLQAGEQEHQALDQVDDQVPEEDSLQPRRRRE